MQQWIKAEFSALDLDDKRREQRAMSLVERLHAKPDGSISQTCEDHAEVTAAYRFLSNEAIEADALRASLYAACVGRLSGHNGPILAIQDTTSLNFSTHPACEGIGPLSAGDADNLQGLHCHTVLAATGGGLPLGILHQQLWARDRQDHGSRHKRKQRPINEKESFRWIESLRAMHERIPPDKLVITVTDREGDIFELLAEPRPPNSRILIRACQNRALTAEGDLLFDVAKTAPEAGTLTKTIHENKPRRARKAELSIRYCEVSIKPPAAGVHDPDLEPVDMMVISARELSPPEDCDGVDWVLITDMEIEDSDGAVRCVEYYSKRWLIERFHYTLKSGCRIEDSQLRTAGRIERLLVLYCAVAWRLLQVTYLSRQDPQQPCTAAFTELEWQTVYRVHHPDKPLPQEPPTLRQMTRDVAKLGGFLGRKSDGEPGVKVIWRGIMRMHDIIIGICLAPLDQDVYKG